MEAGRLTTKDAIKEFVFAGNAIFTVVSKSTGNRLTFKARRKEGKPTFISLLNGPDNTSNYTYMGTVFDNSNTFCLTRNSKVGVDSTSFRLMAWLINQIFGDGSKLDQCEVWHEGHCGRCGRLLTVPESIERGIGPECFKRM